jgi:hypothetical protein
VEEVENIMEKVTVKFTPRPEDYSTTIRIFSSSKSIATSIAKGFLAFVSIILVLIVALSIFKVGLRGLSHLWGYIVPVLILSLLIFLAPSLSGWAMARKVSKQPQLSQPVTYEIGDEKIRIMSSLSESILDWRLFSKVFETEEHYLLVYVTNKNMFQFLAKRTFESKIQENEVRSLIEQKLGKIEDIQKGLRGWKLSLLVFFVLMVGIVVCGLLFSVYSLISDYVL